MSDAEDNALHYRQGPPVPGDVDGVFLKVPLLGEHQQLLRDVERLKAKVLSNAEKYVMGLQELEKLIDSRLESGDRASIRRYDVMTERQNALEEMMKEKVSALDRLMTERVATVQACNSKSFEVTMERVQALQAEMHQAFNNVERSADKAALAADKRFEAVNEFRAQLNDLIATMMPRSEAMAMVRPLETQMDDLKSSVDKGFTVQNVRHSASIRDGDERRGNIALWVAAASVVLTVVLSIMNNAMHIVSH
jgi:hypothetical protein